MANMIENLGLEFMTETEEQTMQLMRFISSEGKPIIGYYGYPYINQHFGDAQLILRTQRNDKEKRFEVMGMDTHGAGKCVWEVRISDVSTDYHKENEDVLERRCIVNRQADGSGMAVVNIINADVLPSFTADETIKLQMVAVPTMIHYYANESEYEDAQPSNELGKKWMLCDGTIFPSGFMHNHDPKNENAGKNDDTDDYVILRGTVKAVYHGKLVFGNETCNGYIRSIIDTQLGPLEVIHTLDQVEEAQRENIRKDSVVDGVFILSGDAAIYEYENGIVLDERNDLALLRYTLLGGDAERMRYALAEDAIYLSEPSKMQFNGRDEIIGRLKLVHDTIKQTCYAHMATVQSIDDGTEVLPYPVGTRCIVLAYGEESKYESIAFIKVNKEGRIAKFVTTVNSRYHFKLDDKPYTENPLDDAKWPQSVAEAILMRARYHGIIDYGVDDDTVLKHTEHRRDYQANAQLLLDSLPDATGDDDNIAVPLR